MPLRVSNSVEKNVVCVPVLPIAVPAATATDVLTDITGVNGEYAGRYIQNTGANVCYYAFGRDCSAINYCGSLAVGQQFDASNCGQRVSVYSAAGTTIGVTLLKRNDNAQGQGNVIMANNNPQP